MITPLVHVQQVSKRFGDTQALHDVSFDVGAGELFGLVGPDGAGKTTLFHVLTTLLLPESGSASVLGLDVVRDLWAIRPRLGYMPGRFALYPDLSVEENLRFFASVFGTTLEAGFDLIRPIYQQIEPFKARRTGALSGGMKQKLALCCALVHRPELLLLDEPTTGVDAVSRREFWELLATLRASGLPIIVSTPYMDEAARCDRICLMQQGRVLAIDRPLDVGRRFPRTLFAVSGAPRAQLLQQLRAYPHTASAYPFGETVHFSDRRLDASVDTVRSELQTTLSAAGVTELHVTPIDAGIEDVFMELMAAEPVVA